MEAYEYINHRYGTAARAKEHVVESLGILAGQIQWTGKYTGRISVPFMLNAEFIISHDCYRVMANGVMAGMVMEEIRKRV